MDAPTPKAELVIVRYGEFMRIFVGSDDAKVWIENQAPRFMSVFGPFLSDSAIAYVSPMYDPAEVEKYLLSYNS